MQEYCIKASRNICFGHLLESPHWGDSNKYPTHMFYEEIWIKQGLSYISFCPLRRLYNSKFIITATSLGTNAVVVTRVHCMFGPYRAPLPHLWNVTVKHIFITKTRLYNFYPLKPHFYSVKLGFTGVYIIFPISAQNIDCGNSLEPFLIYAQKHRLWVLVRTASTRRF